jgi:adenylate cyclase
MGDFVLAVFTVARQAIDAALSCVKVSREADFELHVGIHAGGVIRESGNVFGGAVSVAARIADAADAGEVLVSDVVRSLARTSANATFEDRGEREMREISGNGVLRWRLSGRRGASLRRTKGVAQR